MKRILWSLKTNKNQCNLRKLKKYFWWSFIPSLILFEFLHFFKGLGNSTNANLIVSLTTPSLVALLALFFGIVHFFSQLTKRVSVFSFVFKTDGFFILIIYIIGIVLPLITIKVDYPEFLVNLTISIFAFCFLSLGPFIIALNEKRIEFGIHDIIANLPSLEFPRDTLKFEELMDDLLEIPLQKILYLDSDTIITSLITYLQCAIERKEHSLNKKKAYLGLLTQIGNFYFKERVKRIYFNKIKQMIGRGLNKNCPKTGITEYGSKREELCNLYLIGFSKLFSNLILDKESDAETRLSLAKILLEPSLRIYNFLKRRITGGLKDNLEALKKKIVEFYKERKILREDYENALDSLNITGIYEDIKNEFKEYLKELLDSK